MSASETDLLGFVHDTEYCTMTGLHAYSPAGLVMICKWLGDQIDAAKAGDIATVGRVASKIRRKIRVEQQLREAHLSWSPPLPTQTPGENWRDYVEYAAENFAANSSRDRHRAEEPRGT